MHNGIRLRINEAWLVGILMVLHWVCNLRRVSILTGESTYWGLECQHCFIVFECRFCISFVEVSLCVYSLWCYCTWSWFLQFLWEWFLGMGLALFHFIFSSLSELIYWLSGFCSVRLKVPCNILIFGKRWLYIFSSLNASVSTFIELCWAGWWGPEMVAAVPCLCPRGEYPFFHDAVCLLRVDFGFIKKA